MVFLGWTKGGASCSTTGAGYSGQDDAGTAPRHADFLGIGTVHAFNIVTVKTRVDGHLDRVAFVEGQDVTEGELLAQIDSRPFQAKLAQAQAAKARNEALLANARLDLERTSTLATREYATRQNLDTQRALVLQLEAAIQGDQATIDSATVQLGRDDSLHAVHGSHQSGRALGDM